jgi:hypothetical protein
MVYNPNPGGGSTRDGVMNRIIGFYEDTNMAVWSDKIGLFWCCGGSLRTYPLYRLSIPSMWKEGLG